MTNEKFHNLFGQKPRDSKKDKITQFHMDIASSIQKVTEDIMVKICKSLREEFNIPKSKFTKHEIAVADYVQYILGTVCFKETKNVLKYEGDEAFLKAFEMLGEIAFLSLMQEESVSNALENYVTHIDPEFLRKFD